MSSAYDQMCRAIDAMHSQSMDALSLADCKRLASNLEPERPAGEIRLRAERFYTVLLRDAVGLPPKNKRDAAWLARFDEGKP